MSESPYLWPACDDAYYFTWTQDFTGRIKYLDKQNVERLARSSGFCPHSRCQLVELSNPGEDGRCAPRLCYTKLEKGRPSFGACCFVNGTFKSTKLIGYQYKIQPTPKPIYDRNRIVLGGNASDDSYEAFINANMIYPGIIASQCPLTSFPLGYANTIEDVKRMIIEQNISYWISLAPYSVEGQAPPQPVKGITTRYCRVFPLHFMSELENDKAYTKGITNFSFSNELLDRKVPYINMSYIVSAYYRNNGDKFEIEFNDPIKEANVTIGEPWEKRTQFVRHIWYYNWKDFTVPPVEDAAALDHIAEDAIYTKKQSTAASILITCLSGRGRSGTYSAFLAAKWEGVTSLDELVRIVVGMRESRDGLVETPEQFEYITNLLKLPTKPLSTDINVQSCFNVTPLQIGPFTSTGTYIVDCCLLLFVTISIVFAYVVIRM